MKKFYCLLIVLLVFVTGCQANNENNNGQESWNHKEGYVIAKEDMKVLVVRETTVENIKSKTVQQIVDDNNPDAIWLTVENEDEYNALAVGDMVGVTIDGVVDKSFPEQAIAKKIIPKSN